VAFGIPGTANEQEARAEILGGMRAIEDLTGLAPRFCRPGTGFFDAPCVELVDRLGAKPVGFTISGDAGASFSRTRVRRTLERAPDGAIVLLHMNHPEGATA